MLPNKFSTSSYIFILIILFSYCPIASSQNDVKDFLKVGGDLYTAPFHFDKNDWLNIGVTGAATAGAMFLDKPVKRFFQRNQNDVASFIFEIDKIYYVEGVAIGIAGIYGYGALADDKELKNLGLRLAEASFYTGTVTTLLKALTGRKRPNSDCGCTSYDPFTLDLYESALPSAHSSLSFAFSTVMANYKDDISWKILWYTLSSLTAMARIYHNMHWFSDTVGGAMLGYFIGKFVVNHSTNKSKEPVPAGLVPTPKMFSLKIPL